MDTKRSSDFTGRLSDATAAAILLIVACGAPIYSLFKKMGNVIKHKAQLVNGGMER